MRPSVAPSADETRSRLINCRWSQHAVYPRRTASNAVLRGSEHWDEFALSLTVSEATRLTPTILHTGRMPLQAFLNDPWDVAGRSHLGRSLRYLVQRLVEQQDPATLFAGSGASRLDPISAVVEAIRAASSHHTDNQPTYRLARSLLETVQSTLTAEQTDLGSWFPTPFATAQTELTAALTPLAGTAPEVQLRAATGSLSASVLPVLLDALVNGSQPYRTRLLKRIVDASPASPESWRRLDRAIDLFGAALVAEGRDGPAFAASVVAVLKAAHDHSSAVTAITALVDEPRETFDVAVVLVGTSEPEDTSGYDCTPITTPQRWPHLQASQQADGKLADFRRSYARDGHRSLLATSVQAFDSYGARAAAEARVQSLIDQYSARHRVRDFTMGDSVLTMRRSNERTARLHRTMSPAAKAYPRTSAPVTEMIDTFRYASLARAERAPVVQVLHRWIALEALAHSGRDHSPPVGTGNELRPFPFISARVPDLVALHAIRQSLTATWDVVRSAGRKSTRAADWKEIEAWVGVTLGGRVADLTRWTALLGAKPTSAPSSVETHTPVRRVARAVADQLPDFNPFAQQAFMRWQARLQSAPRFNEWLTETQKQATFAVIRMYALRNASVHSAVGHVDGAQQLTIVARNIVDGTMEVLPAWLGGSPGRPAWEALNAISLRYGAVLAANAGGGVVTIDADRLTRDEGDGITPATTVS
jgi:hypothetical protein